MTAKKQLPKILVLFCGGTIVMQADKNGTLQTQTKAQAIKTLLNLEPKVHDLAQLHVTYIANIDSSNIKTAHWDTIAETIAEQYQHYDGFVITHGTNTMAYTASALSFALPNLGKPVVLTGAQIPGYKIESDARRNFINAVRVATANLAGVYIVFDEEIILGVRSSKVSESKLDAYETINAEDAGEIRTSLRLQTKRVRHAAKLKVETGFASNIAVLTLTPTTEPATVGALINAGVRGIILRGYGPGDVGYNFLPELRYAKQKNIPIVMMSQCQEGTTAMEMNDVGAQALRAGVIQGYDMTVECASTKLMWILHRTNSLSEVKRQMQKNFFGEIARYANRKTES
jgi:L-asparaginase